MATLQRMGKPRSSDTKMSTSLPDHVTKAGSKRGGLSLSLHGGRSRMARDAPDNRGLRRNVSDSEVDELALGGSSHHLCRTLKVCKQCTKKPLRLTARDLQAAALPHDIGDNGLIELIHSIRNQKLYDDGPSVELSQADDIVARAKEKAQEFEDQRKYNIQQHAPQDMNLYQENMDAMGKFDWDELKIGALLGVGGFSNVSEICGFEVNTTDVRSSGNSTTTNGGLDGSSDSNGTRSYTKKEQVARKFLSKHAKRETTPDQQVKDNINSSVRSTNSTTSSVRSVTSSTRSSSAGGTVSYRYALKHLRPKLSEIYNKRTFNCAAVDLIAEAHILLSLQHPNIIKLRGFATAGPQGYRKGNANGFFLIFDQLPETMEQRLVAWRKKVKKYKGIKRSLVSKVLLKKNRETASRRLDELLEERYYVAAEICGAMEYLHHRRMINRDLKIANIGFDIRGDVKLFDFGLSRWLPTSLLTGDKATKEALLEESFHMSSVGTKLYMAPEVMLKQPYSTKADVYSFGVVLWEMLCLSDPQWNREPKEAKDVQMHAAKAQENMPLCPCWAQPVQQILKRCVSPNPSDRPSFTDIRKMFREDMFVFLDGDHEAHGVRPSLGSMKSAEFSDDGMEHDNLKYASDDDVRISSRMSGSNQSAVSDDECDEAQDALGELGPTSGEGAGAPRRRSTYVLNFTDLSWMSSGSLKYGMDSSLKDNSLRDNNSARLDVGEGQGQRESHSTARTSTSSIPLSG